MNGLYLALVELEQQDEDKGYPTVQPLFHNFHMRCVERNHLYDENILQEFVSRGGAGEVKSLILFNISKFITK